MAIQNRLCSFSNYRREKRPSESGTGVVQSPPWSSNGDSAVTSFIGLVSGCAFASELRTLSIRESMVTFLPLLSFLQILACGQVVLRQCVVLIIAEARLSKYQNPVSCCPQCAIYSSGNHLQKGVVFSNWSGFTGFNSDVQILTVCT